MKTFKEIFLAESVKVKVSETKIKDSIKQFLGVKEIPSNVSDSISEFLGFVSKVNSEKNFYVSDVDYDFDKRTKTLEIQTTILQKDDSDSVKKHVKDTIKSLGLETEDKFYSEDVIEDVMEYHLNEFEKQLKKNKFKHLSISNFDFDSYSSERKGHRQVFVDFEIKM